MKGHELPGINQRGYKSKINEGKPGAPKTGSFITDVDELTGEKKTKRVPYDEAVKHKKNNPDAKVDFTNREDKKRSKSQYDKYMAEGKKDLAKQVMDNFNKRVDIAKKKRTKKTDQDFAEDRAFQDKVEGKSRSKMTKRERDILDSDVDQNKITRSGTSLYAE